jgi:pSer/pThr/pTyr-binding forkhead associated (FHA) protein
MARLILSLEGKTLAEYNMNKERYTIGRLPDNDIRIDNPAVSGHHSLIINILNDSFLEDLSSTNGTYVNGKLIKKHALQHGDVITAGHHQLRFVEDEENTQDEFEKTMVIQPSQRPLERLQAAVSSVVAAPPPVDAAPAHATADLNATTASRLGLSGEPPAPLRAKLQVLSGSFAGRELDLVKTLTTLGRPGVQVAAISRRADGFYLVHVDSTPEGNYPLINGVAIGSTSRRLNDNDVIQLASVKMGFFES